ncbi:hypothetical protein GCM10011499_15320 [Pelagibacterium lentulum]|uniref:Uncharacterized protein n=1 Tax=Pelagibacterium lentulum TaxID=2029865 RepID=A0A916R9R3_9HYPH|nr:hypothetical protein GCM10011499_15320 [Pelagibacterium lentulum]
MAGAKWAISKRNTGIDDIAVAQDSRGQRPGARDCSPNRRFGIYSAFAARMTTLREGSVK